MANLYNQMPIQLDTDIASYRAAQTLVAPTSNVPTNVNVWKLVLQVNATSVAGTVTITKPSDGTNLFPPMPVAAGATAGSILYLDEPNSLMNWADFAVTGLTATSTRLWLWYRS